MELCNRSKPSVCMKLFYGPKVLEFCGNIKTSLSCRPAKKVSWIFQCKATIRVQLSYQRIWQVSKEAETVEEENEKKCDWIIPNIKLASGRRKCWIAWCKICKCGKFGRTNTPPNFACYIPENVTTHSCISCPFDYDFEGLAHKISSIAGLQE